MDKERFRTVRQVANLRQGRNDWYRIENKTAGEPATVYIYDEIGWFGVTAADFVKDLQAVTADTIDLHLNTPGGDAFEGIAIYNSLKQHKATVNVLIDGLAASAGSFIAQAGDTISIARNAQMMIHEASGLVIGNASDMADMAALLDKMSNNVADIYAQRAGGTVTSWRDAMRAETYYSSSEAVAAGLADDVTGETDTTNNWDLSIYAHAGREQTPPPPTPARDMAPVMPINVAEFRAIFEKEAAGR